MEIKGPWIFKYPSFLFHINAKEKCIKVKQLIRVGELLEKILHIELLE